MILYFYRIIIIIPSLISVLSLSSLAQTSTCIQSCGETPVQYPFGFSDKCEIKLNCSTSSGDIRIGDFSVRNVTSDQILINLPANCSRPIGDLSQFYGANFAPTWRNGFLLENCSSAPSNDCVVPSRLLSTTGFENCNSGSGNTDHHNISCYSGGLNDNSSDLLDYAKIRGNGHCGVLFSSIMVGLNKNSSLINESSSIPLDFQIVELGWWVNGSCGCHPNASCSQVANGRHLGFRCKCNQGFTGDGFAAGGNGCRRDCSASRYISGRCRNKAGIVVGGIIAGASLAAGLAVICYCLKRRSSALQSRLSAKRLISEASGSTSVPFYPYKEIERASNGFSEKQRLGTGAYGTVYAGKLHNDEWVAIKKLRYRDHESVDQVMNEIKLLSSVSHPNLVRLLGCCIDHGEQILVYEFMPNGTLSQHLQRERGSVLPWTIRLTIAAETAHAVAHLHSAMNPPIFHRDIKSSNILLDYNFNSKLADFGLSRIGGMTDDSHISTAPQGTPGYVDPQYHQNFHLSDKSDVYSFGVVLVEIITAMKVVDFSRPHSEINLAAMAIDRIGKGRVDDIIDPFLEPNRDAWTLSSVHKVAELAFRCLAFHRDMRPSMTEVADELEQIRRSGWAPLDESVHMGSSVASSCSSPYQGSEKSFNTTGTRKTGVGSKRLIVTQKTVAVGVPVSVQDVWLSEESSPSTNSLLGNVVR
ncbi:wall-associated receptor kinase-like 14 [Phtheirospermum japonicum]|uniref:Wall-associated receptor kinase-like 14 n=1 Tax=Phtheirospermum japonicum TaxID=374723 RepID=A0A830D193_9LAMI|nr:wall-associated receptor kinase-like 14 [Phtheirospermum japonicum]